MTRVLALLAGLGMFFAVAAHAADPSLSAAANAAFLAANAKKPGVVVRPSGLQYRIIKSGFGKRPGPADNVTVNYTGRLINGTVFDGTEPGFPAELTVNQVIAGWTEALQLMREGDHWELVIPPNLGYGEKGAGDGKIPPNQTLIFDLQLVSTSPPPPDQQQPPQ